MNGRKKNAASGDQTALKNRCPAAKDCGGCAFAGKTYIHSCSEKYEYVKKLMPKDCAVYDINTCDDPFHYRNKVHSGFKKLRNGKIICGPYEQGSHRIVEVDSCLIENETASAIIRDCADIAAKTGVPVYNETTCTGELRRVLVRTADKTGEIMVVIVIGSRYFRQKTAFIKELTKRHPEITTLLINVNRRRDSMILGNETKKVTGKGYITDILLGKKFRISPSSFYQVNRGQAEVLYGTAVRLADFSGTERVIDAYCGTGTTTLTFADYAESITGVEINPEAVADAVRNAKTNGVKNAEFVCADAVEYMEDLAAAGEKIDVVMMDPTRLGTDERFIKACEKLSPEKIVYISCNPDTLARDIRLFEKCGYHARAAEPVDMFPWTSSIETVVLLSKLSNAPKLEVKINMSELDLTEAEAKATYDEIQEYVKQQTGLHVTHLNIAQIKRKHGIIERVNYNLPKSENSRQPNCPPEKEKAIVTALKHFKMIK